MSSVDAFARIAIPTSTNRFCCTRLCAALFLLHGTISGLRAGSSSGEPQNSSAEDSATHYGITGDWGGARRTLSDCGLSFDLRGVYSFQGVAAGGLERGDDVGQLFSGILSARLDTEKAGLWPGGSLQLRLEGRSGETVLGRSGAISPVNNQALFPLVEGRTGDAAWALTELTFTQHLTDWLALTGGLMNTAYGDHNPITGNALSNEHFSNLSLLFSPVAASVMPAVTLGGGILLRPAEWVRGSFTVIGSEETAGFNPFELYEGTTFSTEWEFEYEVVGRPGGMVFGALYSIRQPRLPFGSTPRLVLEELEAGEEIETDADSWAVFWNGFQYLHGNEERGWGIFARCGLGDGAPNPVRWHVAAGVGGTAPFPGRDRDRWGVGGYYLDFADGTLAARYKLGVERGVECFYNAALTRSLQLTLDAQIIDSAIPEADTVVVLGARLVLQF